MFFLLSFLLLLINDLCLDYLYRNHNDHNDEWPPSSQHKQGARTRYVLFFKNLLLFSLLNVYLQQTYHNGNEWPLLSLSAEWTQARDADVSWFQYVNFLYFFFFTPLNNYLQTDYMYGMATRMTTVNDHPVKDDEWGTRDADDASQVPGMFFFLYLFLFYWLTFIIWLHCEDKHTPPPPPPPQQMGLEMHLRLEPRVYIFSFDTTG